MADSTDFTRYASSAGERVAPQFPRMCLKTLYHARNFSQELGCRSPERKREIFSDYNSFAFNYLKIGNYGNIRKLCVSDPF